MKRRVVITGLGVISPCGHGKENFWKGITSGKSAVGHVTRFDAKDMSCHIAAEVKDFEPGDYMDKKEAKRMDRFAQYAVASANMALKDSGLSMNKEDPNRIGVWIGSGIGGVETFEQQFKIYQEKGAARVSPFFVPMLISNMAAGQVSIALKAKGPCGGVVTACATGTNAVGDAFNLVRYGKSDVVFAGGSEASITPLAMAGFASAKAMSTLNDNPEKASRPFDLHRDGFVMGEGAGVLVLEELKHAIDRGAHIYGEIIGYGSTSDAFHIVQPAPGGEGGARAMAEAIVDAGIAPHEVGYINAHGTSTPFNDKFETEAIKSVFKDYAKRLAVSSTKSSTGHMMGAAGAVELISVALALEKQILPPTINYETCDPECDLDYVPNEPRHCKVEVAMSNSLGFGGHNATVVVKKYKE